MIEGVRRFHSSPSERRGRTAVFSSTKLKSRRRRPRLRGGRRKTADLSSVAQASAEVAVVVVVVVVVVVAVAFALAAAASSSVFA